MRSRKNVWVRGWGASGGKLFVIVLLFFVAFGCAPKKIRPYESIADTRTNVVQSAISLSGRPYKSGAKGPDAFDCSGLVYYAYKGSGIVLPLTADELSRVGCEISREGVLPGDLVFFKAQKDLHVGIMINKREFVHASKSRGVTIDSVDSSYWSRHLRGFRGIL